MPLRIGQVQIMNIYSGQNYLPYSVGLLEAYARRHLEGLDRFEFLIPLYKREPIADAATRLEPADLVLFSTFVWNFRYSLAVASELKRRKPDVLIAFGGPHVPDRAEAFLREHPQVDLACHKEGEGIICPLLEGSLTRSWEKVPSVSWLEKDGTFRHNPIAPRIRNLEEIPSPYLDGVFQPLMEAHPDERWLMLWETNRGCPYSCTFCDWGSYTQSKLYLFSQERLEAELEWSGAHRIPYIFCCDANFGMLDRDTDLARFAGEVRAKGGFPETLSVQTTKGNVENIYRTWRALIDSGLNKEAAMPLQSVDADTLTAVKRINMPLRRFRELHHRFAKDNIRTYSDILIGLPGERYDAFADGVGDVIENGQHYRIQFGNLSILPNAPMAEPAYREKYGVETIFCPIVSTQTALMADEEIPEMQELVVSTAAMPREDWRRARVFAYATVMLHCYRSLQIPLLMLHHTGGMRFRNLIEAFTGARVENLPTLKDMLEFFQAAAVEIQKGEPEYVHTDRLPGIRLPADDLFLVLLRIEGRYPAFYEEAEALLEGLIADSGAEVPPGLLHDAVRLNALLIQGDGTALSADVELRYNLWEVFQGCLTGEEVPLEAGRFLYRVNRMASFYQGVTRLEPPIEPPPAPGADEGAADPGSTLENRTALW